MRVSIAHKIFLSWFLVSAVLIILVTVAMQTTTGRGFAGYLSKASLDRMEWLPSRLEQLYARTGDWSALRDQPGLWEQICGKVRPGGSSRRPRPAPRARAGTMWPAAHRHRHRRRRRHGAKIGKHRTSPYSTPKGF